MTCDWEKAKAVDSFFGDPDGLEVRMFSKLSDLLDDLGDDRQTVKAYRNPVHRTVGFHNGSIAWSMSLSAIKEDDDERTSIFSDRLRHADYAKTLSTNG